MKAIWLEDGALSVRDVPVPEPPTDEAFVKVQRAGICNTDLELVRGYYPFTGVLGHEFVGVVEAGPSQLMGRRVVGEINAVCGECRACREDRRNHCENRTVLGIVGRDGAFAEYLALPIDNLHLVPENVSDDEATFTEPLAAALEIQEQIDVTATDRVLVVGDGKLGQLIARALALTECDLTVLGRHDEKLELLALHGNTISDASSIQPAAFDIAVECTGNADGFAAARRALRPRGTLVLKSTYASDLTFDASALVVDEITLVGSRCGPFAPALELLASGTIDVTPLIHARYALEDGIDAFEHAVKPGVLKVLLEIE